MAGALNFRNVSNLGALSAIQLANALVPIIVFPFALSVLGADIYAELAIAEALSVIVLTAVLYSFEVEGVGRVIDLRADGDHDGLGRLLVQIIAARLFLFVASAAVTLAIVTGLTGRFPKLLALWLLVPLGHVFYSYWFYQGVERNIPAALATVAARVAGVALVLASVRDKDDAWLIPLALGGTFCIGGIVAATYLAVRYGARMPSRLPRLIGQSIWDGRTIVLGNAAVVLYRDLNVVVLGATGVSSVGVAAYSLAEKVIKMVQASSRPINQLFFPKAINAIRGEATPTRHNGLVLARMTAPQLAIMAALLAGAACVYQFAIFWNVLPEVWRLPSGLGALTLVMVPGVFLGVANYMFGVVGLNYLGARGALAGAIVMTGVTNLIVCAALSAWMGAMGGALAFALAELVLLVQILLRYRKRS